MRSQVILVELISETLTRQDERQHILLSTLSFEIHYLCTGRLKVNLEGIQDSDKSLVILHVPALAVSHMGHFQIQSNQGCRICCHLVAFLEE